MKNQVQIFTKVLYSILNKFLNKYFIELTSMTIKLFHNNKEVLALKT